MAISNLDEAPAAATEQQQPPRTKRKSFRRSWFSQSLRQFRVNRSTEDLHGVEYNNTAATDGDFCNNGPYAHLRKIILSNYASFSSSSSSGSNHHYKHYTKERQWLQDAIIDDCLGDLSHQPLDTTTGRPIDENPCITPVQPWIVFTVGVKGAGKIHTLKHLVQTGRLPLLPFVLVDPDGLRRRLPEYQTYDKAVVNDLTRKESSFLAELLLSAAVQNGRNVVFDSSLQHPDWFLALLHSSRENHPECALNASWRSYKFALVHITAPIDLVWERIEKKSKETGRSIAPETIQQGLETISKSIAAMKPAVDYFCQIENGETYSLTNHERTWDDFRQTFSQACAWKPRNSNDDDTIDADSLRRVKHPRISQPRSLFSAFVSSEENNASPDAQFYGRFSHIRKTLDYSYHSHYTFARQKLHDAIVTDLLNEAYIRDAEGRIGTIPMRPWIVFTAGAMGAGKSYTMRRLVETERFPLPAFVIVDPDEIRRLLPEYHVYIAENPELAGDLTRKEAGYIAEVLTLAALQGGKNVLQDGSLRDHEWYRDHFRKLKHDFPRVRQAIIHVTAPRQAIMDRAAQRALATGRIVPSEVLEEAIEKVPRSVKILAPMVDYYAEINNAPGVDDVELVKPEGSNWTEFRQQWIQRVAYESNSQQVLDQIEKAKEERSKKAIF